MYEASLVVLVHNHGDLTATCLRSIEQNTPEPHELILVDNGSGPVTEGYLAAYAAAHDHVKLIRIEENSGFAAGMNRGMYVASAPVVILNNDTRVSPGWLSRLLETDGDLVGPMSNYTSGEQQLDNYDGDLAETAAQIAGEPAIPAQQRLGGFCMLIRPHVLLAIGGFDTSFGIGNFEDDDYYVRATLAGYRSVIARSSFVEHVGHQTFMITNTHYAGQIYRNWQIFAEKWNVDPDEIGIYDVEAIRASKEES